MMTMTLSGLSLVTKEPPAMGQRALRPDFGKAGKQVQVGSAAGPGLDAPARAPRAHTS